MMLTPEQRPTLTISNDGRVLTETIEDIELPADYSFATINDYVHDVGRHFEELQCLALGMASHIDAQQARIAELEQDAARYRWLRDNGELPMVIIGSRWYGTQHAGCLDLNEFVDSEMQK